jgi:predicted metalloprotease with PDZ domain
MILLLPALLFTQPPDSLAEPIGYTLVPRSRPDRTELEVRVRTELAPGSLIQLELPRDCYGTPDLHRFVRDLVVERGTRIRDSSDRVLRLTPDEGGRLQVSYVLSFDPAVLDGSAFAPSVGPGHFHVAGCQWMLRPDDVQQRRRYRLEVQPGAASWHLYSSLSANPARIDTAASYRDLLASAVGGSLTPPAEFDLEGRTLRVFLQGKYDGGREPLALSILKIVRGQRAWFRDPGPPLYTVTILPRTNRLAGTSIPNLFVCFVGPDRSLDEILTLIAHETTHNWIPNQLSILTDSGAAPRFQWWNEGVADYVARKLLRSEGVMTEDRFVELVNADLDGLASNPFAEASLDRLIEVARSGTTGGPYFRLPYNRGAVMALRWDEQLTRAGRPDGLKIMLLDLMAAATARKGPLPEDSLYAVAARHGIDLRTEFDRYILRGEAIEPPAGILADQYRLKAMPVPSPFDAGFAVDRSARSGVVRGVAAGGVAETAGLRNGLPITRIDNWNRFSPHWRVDQPVEVTVRLDGKSDTTMKIMPRGNPSTRRFYRRTDPRPSEE